jgi:hypothetical protein
VRAITRSPLLDDTRYDAMKQVLLQLGRDQIS